MDKKLLPRGIYTPLPTFFTENEDLDLDSLRKHVVFVSQAGTIPVLAGSAGEAPHLTGPERITLIKTARAALDSAGLVSVPIVAGVGACSTRETIQLSRDAAEAGADFAMVIPPGYYAGQLQKDGSQAIKDFFIDIASASPIPVIMYNFPGVSSGIDLDSNLITDVVCACPNIVGVKLTCANVGKITRITAVVNTVDFRSKYPRSNPKQDFLVIDGYIDILLPSISSGSGGAISGLPNIAPRLCVRLWELASSESAQNSDDYREAQRLQNIVALADGVAASIGVAGLKMMVHKRFAPAINYRPHPRRPLLPMSLFEGSKVMDNKYLRQVLIEEEGLSV